ncbi:type I restriction endonuclease [Halovenus sp. HT40]|uniref:type I restriction endonuclease n=1 Tax=Halovenus sp. HT40 TaxID=3126691 RepID=UPI00300EE752
MTENHAGGSFPSLAAYVSTASRVVATGQTLDEANTKAKLITPLLRTLGWRVHDNEEVLLEYSGDENFNDRVDYALFGPDGVYAVVEAKQIGRDISNDTAQLRRYMRLFGAQWGMLTNGDDYIVYEKTGDSEETLVDRVSLSDFADSDIIRQLTREQAYDQSDRDGTASVDQDQQSVPPGKIEAFADQKLNTDTAAEQSTRFSPLYDSLIASLAPSVYGSEVQKLALLCSLVGGVPKQTDNPTRGAIHILIVHDPGTQTVDLIEEAAQAAPGSVTLSGGSEAQSLFRVATGDAPVPSTDVSAYPVAKFARAPHAMISQLGEIDDAGLEKLDNLLNTDLPAEPASQPGGEADTTAVIAHTEPKYGRFDEFEPTGEQIGLGTDIINGFDLIFKATDQPDREEEDRATHVLEQNHVGEVETLRDHSQTDKSTELETVVNPSPLDKAFLRAYLTYARSNYVPTLTSEAKQTLKSYYTELREEGLEVDTPVPISAQKLESLVRLAEGSARLRLSETVEQEDAVRATEIVQAQLESIGLQVDLDSAAVAGKTVIENSAPQENRDVRTLYYIVQTLETDHGGSAPLENIMEEAARKDIPSDAVTAALDELQTKGGVSEIEGERFVANPEFIPEGDMLGLIESLEEEFDKGAPVDVAIERFEEWGFNVHKAEHEIEKLKTTGEVYEPRNDYLRTT